MVQYIEAFKTIDFLRDGGKKMNYTETTSGSNIKYLKSNNITSRNNFTSLKRTSLNDCTTEIPCSQSIPYFVKYVPSNRIINRDIEESTINLSNQDYITLVNSVNNPQPANEKLLGIFEKYSGQA
jgi:hypothetical protein